VALLRKIGLFSGELGLCSGELGCVGLIWCVGLIYEEVVLLCGELGSFVENLRFLRRVSFTCI